jgi:hypothetical protein
MCTSHDIDIDLRSSLSSDSAFPLNVCLDLDHTQFGFELGGVWLGCAYFAFCFYMETQIELAGLI